MTGALPGPDVASSADADGWCGAELYVYYRLDARHAAEAAEVARACQRHACVAQPGLAARLLRRSAAGKGDAQQTWMEIYRLLPDAPSAAAGIDAALQAAIEAQMQPLAAFIDGTRHVERFTAFACA